MKFIKKYYKEGIGLFFGVFLGGGITVFVADHNGISWCNIFEMCGEEETILQNMRRLEREIEDNLTLLNEANDVAINATRELSDYQGDFSKLLGDIGVINKKIQTINSSGLDKYERIEKETKYIRNVMRKINAYGASNDM